MAELLRPISPQSRLLEFQTWYEAEAEPFEWKFTRADLARLLVKLHEKEAAKRRAG